MARKGGSERSSRRSPAASQGLGLLLGLLLAPILPVFVSAQQTGSVAGTVTDVDTSEPLPAVQVFVPDTPLNAQTNAQGQFRLDGVPAGVVEVRVVRLGYSPMTRAVEVAAGQVTTADFPLSVSAVALDALVVTATGLRRRREVGSGTAAVQVARELERVVPVTVTSLLQGRAPGVTILQGAGSVGTASTIKIRGNTSINLNNTPLIYVDGVRVSNSNASGPGVGGQAASRLDDLNLDDIESIEIAKGPSAATLYGTEAAAGVIRITTKRGRPGAPAQWTFFSETGSNWDDTAWPDNVFHARSLSDAAPDTLYRMNLLEGLGTNLSPWRTGREQALGGSVRGGMDQATYFLSGSWEHREGSLPNNEETRRSARANFNLALSENTDIAVSTWFGTTELALPDNDNNSFGYIGVGLIAPPWELPLRRDDPVTGERDVATCAIDYESSRVTFQPLGTFGCQENPFFSERTFEDVATLENRQHVERFTGSATLEYRPLGLLSARGTLGYDQYSDQSGSFVPVDPERPFDELSRGFRNIGSLLVRDLTMQGDVVAAFEISPSLRSTTSVGVQFLLQRATSAASVGRILPPGTKVVSSAVTTEGFEGLGESRKLGFYLEEQLAFSDRLFVTPAIRVDDNTAEGENLGLQAYPRVMASYVVSEESWFQDFVPGSFVESLRVRGAWGRSGKHPSAFAPVAVLGTRRVTFWDEDDAGVVLTQPGNPELKPEKGRELELGFEADLLDGRLGLDFTWFKKVAVDAIVFRQLAPSTGYLAALATNIGETENTGTELALYAAALSGPRLQWDWQLNLSTVKGKITKLDEPIIYGVNGDSQRHQEGYPYGAYFSRDYWIGENGNVQSTEEPVFVGHPTPEWEGSLSSTLTLFGWLSLYANLGFAGGHQQFNSTEEFRCGYLTGSSQAPYIGICPEIYERDRDGGRTDAARIKVAAAEDIQYAPWVEDADFARLRTVSARFDIPEAWASRIGGTRASFTLQAENVALFTNYTGLDPEVNSAGPSQSLRLDFLSLPPAKRVTGRLEITF